MEISQLKNKKFWWMDIIFYFVLSLFVATMISYAFLLLKDNLQRQDIATVSAKLLPLARVSKKNMKAL